MKYIQAMFRRARAERIIESSPFDLLEKRKMQSKPKEPFEVDEVGKLIAVCRQREWLDKETVIWLRLCTGARFTDCAQMSTKHLDRDKWVLQWQERKTKKAMVVPVVECQSMVQVRLLVERGECAAILPSLGVSDLSSKQCHVVEFPPLAQYGRHLVLHWNERQMNRRDVQREALQQLGDALLEHLP